MWGTWNEMFFSSLLTAAYYSDLRHSHVKCAHYKKVLVEEIFIFFAFERLDIISEDTRMCVCVYVYTIVEIAW